MQEMLKLAGFAFIPAALIAGICFAVGWLRQRDEPGETRCCGLLPWDAVGIFMGFVWGYLALNQTWFPNPERGIVHWLPYGLLLGLGLGCLPKCCGDHFRPATLILTVILFALFFTKISSVYSDWTIVERLVAIIGVGLVVLAIAYVSQLPQTARLPAWNAFLTYGLTCAALIPAFFIAGSSKWAQVIGVAGILCAPGFILAVLKPAHLSATASFLFATIFWVLTVYVYFFTDYLPTPAFLILLILPTLVQTLLGWTMDSPRQQRIRFALYLGLVAAGGIAVYLTKAGAPPPSPYL